MDKTNKILLGIMALAVVSLFMSFYPKQTKSIFGAAQENSFKNVTATTTTTAAGVPKVVMVANSSRNYAVITNTTATIAYIGFISASINTPALLLASTTDQDYPIPLAASGGSYTINLDNKYTGQIVASSSAAVTIRTLSAY